MPFVNIKTVRGLLTEKQKSELQEKIIDLLVEYEGYNNPKFRQHVWVLIEDFEPSSWSLGGHPPSPELVRKLYAETQD